MEEWKTVYNDENVSFFEIKMFILFDDGAAVGKQLLKFDQMFQKLHFQLHRQFKDLSTYNIIIIYRNFTFRFN